MRIRPLVTALALAGALGALGASGPGAPALGAQVPVTGAKAAAQHAADAANAQLSQQTGQQVPQRPAAAPSSNDLNARLRSMPSLNVPPIKTGSAPRQGSPSSTVIPRAQSPRRPSLTTGPAAPLQATGNGPSSATKRATPGPAKNTTANPAEASTGRAPAESLATKRGADTTVMQQGAAATAGPATAAPAAGRPARRDSALVMREQYDYNRDGRRDPFVSLMTTRELRPTLSDLRLTSVLYDPSGRRPVAIMRDSLAGVQWRVTTGMTLGRMRVTSIRPKVVVFTIEEFGFSRMDSLMLRDTTRVRSK